VEDDTIFHPLVSKYLIKIADSDLLEERLDDLLHLKKALEKKRRRREEYDKSLGPLDKAWLERIDAKQDDISTMLRETKEELEELRQQCLVDGLGDEIGRGSVSEDYSSCSSCSSPSYSNCS
jgi:septal ring factor EnvC (AmiA/AmiB activator)